MGDKPPSTPVASAPFVLPTYGMPCCGHRIVQHSDEPNPYGDTSRCHCCRDALRLGNALVLMADSASPQSASSAPYVPEGGS